jgi:hypothetical protein
MKGLPPMSFTPAMTENVKDEMPEESVLVYLTVDQGSNDVE